MNNNTHKKTTCIDCKYCRVHIDDKVYDECSVVMVSTQEIRMLHLHFSSIERLFENYKGSLRNRLPSKITFIECDIDDMGMINYLISLKNIKLNFIDCYFSADVNDVIHFLIQAINDVRGVNKYSQNITIRNILSQKPIIHSNVYVQYTRYDGIGSIRTDVIPF
jgi:hypothetical protein